MNGLKVAVLGGRESVMGFRALGLDVFPTSPSEAEALFKRLVRQTETPYAIIYVTEELLSVLDAQIRALKDALYPAVIPIPSKDGSLGLGMTALNAAVERAVGANIL